MKSGVQAADWLVIAKQLKLTTQTLAGAFLKAWKESDYTRPSWENLAKALRAIGGGWYENASQQAEKNAGTYVHNNFTRIDDTYVIVYVQYIAVYAE